jgi:hypothetical protein
MLSEAPLAVCVEKLRGFVADHHAEVLAAEGDAIQLLVTEGNSSFLRRVADRPLRLIMDLKFEEIRREQLAVADGAATFGAARTKIRVSVASQKKRERRQEQAAERARQLLVSFRSYLMATEIEQPPDPGVFRRARGLFGLWLGKS